MQKNLESKNIEQLLAEADDLIQQIHTDAINDIQEEHRLQFEKHAQNLKKIKSEFQNKIEKKGTSEISSGAEGNQQLHTDASYTKENSECGSDCCSSCLASECLWSHRKHLGNSYWLVKGLIILLTEFKQKNCKCKEVVSRVTSWIDCQSIQSVLSVEAEQKADSGHPELLLGAEPMAGVLWMRFLQHNQANPEVLARRSALR